MDPVILEILKNVAGQGLTGSLLVLALFRMSKLEKKLDEITKDRLDEGKTVVTALVNTNNAQEKVADALDHAADASGDVADGMRNIAEAVRLLQAGVTALQQAIERVLR